MKRTIQPIYLRSLQYFLFFAIVLILSSCDNLVVPNPIACTKIGCTDGIVLKLSSSLPNNTIIEVISNGSTLKTINCNKSYCSGNNVFIEGLTPAQFSIKISNGNTVLHESTHTPNYTINKPNGPDCPPECKQTEIPLEV